MPTPGPWIQGDDFIDEAYWSSPGDTFGMTLVEYVDYSGNVWTSEAADGYTDTYLHQLTMTEAGTAFDLAQAALASSTTPFSSAPVEMTWDYKAGSFGLANWESYARARMRAEKWRIYPARGWYDGEGFTPFYYEPSDPPAGAIGFELEGDGLCDPLGVAIGPYTYLNATAGDASDGGVTDSLSYTSHIISADGGTLDIPLPYAAGASTSTYLDDTVDITHLLGEDGTATIWARTTDLIEPKAPEPSTSGFWNYGTRIQYLDLLWTLHPPRHRWLFDIEQPEPPEPYRRVLPRDDALAGGPGRNYPPSRAAQSSNRTSGYL